MTASLPVRARLEGFPSDIAAVAEEIACTPDLTVVEHSRFYPNRRGNPARGRLYLEILPPTSGSSQQATDLPRLPGGER